MKKLNEILMVFIFMLTAVLTAAVGLKAYDIYDTNRRLAREQEELELAQVMARNMEAHNRVSQMQAEILERAEDKEELERFINRIQSGELTVSENGVISSNGTVSGNGSVSMNGTVTGNSTVSMNGTVTGNSTVSMNGTVTGNSTVSMNGTVSANDREPAWDTVSANGTVSGNIDAFGNVIPRIKRNVSGNEEINYYDGTMTDSSIFDEWRYIYKQEEMSLDARRLLRTSLEETLEVNQADRERIAENKTDFSGVKIACLGDSITAAANLEGEEGYQQYAYPARLKELLGAEEVYNLGIGGSSIARYWSDPYVERYQEIPEDTDIIIVMGGTNDAFCASDKEFGNLEERAYRTFCGDLNELMKGIKEKYPNAEVFFATPLPNVLQDYLMKERDYLLPQQKFVDVIKTLAAEYDYEVIDLYNSNILDSHDANVVADYIPDGVHGNHDGYQIMAEHFASELVQHYEGGENAEAETVSANRADSSL
ncbi:MAG: hypothetical protein K2P48_12980 [Lachnospiraceae bacterium]|nr:hypothetical protein [Lachnospiraceae bacterium]